MGQRIYFPLFRIHHRLNGLVLVILLLLMNTISAQTIRYVKPSPSGSGDGSSWANATSDLHASINSLTATGGQVWVASGIYKPTTTTGPNSRNISFAMKSKVAIYGGFSGNENSLSDRVLSYPSSTTLSGNIGDESTDADNSYHVIVAGSVDSTAVLDGFVITGGNGNGSLYNNTDAGGGLWSISSSIRLNNCFFLNNYALSGGGFMVYHFSGGGNISVGLTNCLFQNNSSSGVGGAISIFSVGGSDIRLTLSNCSFQSNRGNDYGGGIFVSVQYNRVYANLINCSFQSNIASRGAAIAQFSVNSTPIEYIQTRLVNCVVFGNGGASSFYSGYGGSTSTTPLINARYSLFEQSVTGYIPDNTNQTTLFSPFASLTSTQLAPCSPAINAGDPNTTTYMAGFTDLAGNPRFVGNLDMGPYEFQTTPCPEEFYSIQTGRWNDPATWSTGRLPTGSDVVHLKHSVTIPQNYLANARKIRVETTAPLLYETGGRLQLSP